MSDPKRTTRSRHEPMSALGPILLQKSKVASVRIFGEILKREAIDDSDSLSRVTEVAYEFSVGR
jgi:predicted nucleotidyltransferase